MLLLHNLPSTYLICMVAPISHPVIHSNTLGHLTAQILGTLFPLPTVLVP